MVEGGEHQGHIPTNPNQAVVEAVLLFPKPYYSLSILGFSVLNKFASLTKFNSEQNPSHVNYGSVEELV